MCVRVWDVLDFFFCDEWGCAGSGCQGNIMCAACAGYVYAWKRDV